MPSLLVLQWGLIGFYVVIYFFIGFLRGGSKSTYFTIVAFITTFISLYLISFISLNLFLSNTFTLVNLLELANSYAGGIIPADVMTYAADPVLAAFAIAVIDLVLRIIGFIILYPLIKGLLTLIIFRPIWSFGIKKALLRRQNEKLEDRSIERGEKQFRPRKRLKKNFFGRFWGGFMGATQGVLVAFITLLPLLIMAGFLTVPGHDEELSQASHTVPLAEGLPGFGGMEGMLDDYLAQIDEMNAQGLGAMVKQITISGKPLDRYIFDRIFTTQVKHEGTTTNINWINELEGILQITRTLYDGKYVENGFKIQDINENTIKDLDVVFNYLKTSDLMAYMIPTASAFGLDMFKDQLPAGITDEMAAQALEGLQGIDWKTEFGNIQAIVNAVLTFGSAEELMNYMADPNLLLDLTPEQGEKLADVIRAFGDMQILELISVAAEYATQMDTLQAQLSWIAEEERQAYLEEKLAFIIDDKTFFNAEFARVALLIEALYSDEFGDVNLRALINVNDVDSFMAAQNEEWIDHLLEKIVDLELLLNAIPFGVDYALYTQVGDLVDQELAGQIETALNEIDWQAEILNVGDIYKDAINIGAAQLLGDNPDYIAYVDQVAQQNMPEVRIIVSRIFEQSALVNAALELAAPLLVDRFVTNQDLAGIVQEALMSDPESGVVDFNVGQEINTILDIVEKIYLFTTASELVNLSGMTTESRLALFAEFGTLTESEFNGLKTAFANLQLLNRVGESGLVYARDIMGISQIYVPETVDLGKDIGSVLGLGYYVAQYTKENKVLFTTYEDIDFAPLFADDTFRSYLLPTLENNHSALLLATLAHNAKIYADNPSFSGYLSIPDDLKNASPESTLWQNELSALLGAIFDIAASFEDSEALTLSYREVITLSQAPTQANIKIITQFADPVKADDAFGSLDSSIILRSSLKKAIDTFGASTGSALNGYEVKTPAIAHDGFMLNEGIFVELIQGLALMIDDLNQTWMYERVSELIGGLNPDAIIPAYNNLQNSSLISFGNITLIKGVISEALLSEDIKSFGIEKLNGAQTFFAAPNDFLDLDPLLLDSEGVKGDEIGKLLISMKSLQLPNMAALSSFGPVMMAEMAGRNVSGGMDDLDRFFDSGILYTFLDRVIQLDDLSSFVNDALSTAFEGASVTIDIAPHPDILGQDGIDEPIEVGRITKNEFRNMVISVGLISPITGISIQTFPKLIDPMATEDDFTTFLASDYIYTIIGRLFENEAFGDYVGGFLSGAFGDGIDLDMASPSDAKGTTGVEEGIITKHELRRIMVSFKLIGLDEGTENINEEKILNLKGQNDVSGVDDFDRFIESKYIADKLSIILTSDAIIEMLANGRFVPADFVLPVTSYTIIDGRKRLTNEEFANIFGGLNVLGIKSFSGETVTIETLGELESEEVDELLTSDYLYTFLDLMLKSETSFTIPSAALETSGAYDGMVKKSEIADIFVAVSIFGLAGGQPPAPEEITIAQIQDLLDQTNSAIVQALLSEAIIEALGVENIPDDAYESAGLLTQQELDAIVAALAVIAGDPNKPVTEVADSISTLTVGQVNDLDLTETGSVTIKQMISDEIIAAINASNVPEEAYNPLHAGSGTVLLSTTMETPLRRLSDAELVEIIAALNVLANNEPLTLVSEISMDVKVGQAVQLKTNNSYLIRQLISDNIVSTLDTLVVIPNSAYIDVEKTRLTNTEINQMIDAMVVLAKGDLELPVASITTDVNVGQTQGLKTNSSLIIRQLITDNMVDVLGAAAIPNDAYDPLEPTMLTADEVTEMIDALYILAKGDNDLPVASVSTDVNVGQVQELNGGTSLIIRQLITDNIVDVLGATVSIHPDAYDPLQPTMLTITEIDEMVAAMIVLADGDLELPVASISTDVNVGQTQELKDSQSLIIRQLITDNVEDVLLTTVVFPTDAYDTNYPTMLTSAEISQMVEAMVVLANGDLLLPVASISTNVTVGQTKGLKDNTSLIINQLVSDKIVETLSVSNTIPDSAYVDPITKVILKDSEIDHMIDALDVLADGDDDMLVSAVPTDVTIGQLRSLSTSSSIIIQRLITDAIVDAVNLIHFPDTAYVGDTPGDQLKTLEIENMILALEVLAGSVEPGDKDHIKVSAVSTDVTVGQTQTLNQNESLIINQLISESIVSTLTTSGSTIPDDAYIDPIDKKTLTADEMTEMIDALVILANGNLNLPVANVSTDVTVGQTKDLKTNASVIIRQLISDAIVDSVGLTATIPADAYTDPIAQERLKDSEINHMIDALDILANGNDALLVADVSTDITIGQLDSLTLSPSIIMQKLITDSIVDAVGADKVPDEAYLSNNSDNNLKPEEVGYMIDALRILANDPLDPPAVIDDVKVSAIGIDVTVGQTKDLKTNNSLIIKQVISDAIVEMLTEAKVRETAYITPAEKDRLTNDEIGYMIDALDVLSGGNDNLLVSAITVNENSLSIADLQLFSPNSIILNRLISNAIIDGLGADDIPSESYEDAVAKTDLIRPEIDAILLALETLGIGTSGAGGIGMADLTFADLDIVVAIGTTDLVKYPLGFSPIVVHILSAPMISAVTDVRSGHEYGVPSTAYRNTIDLLHEEIEGLVDALKVIRDASGDPLKVGNDNLSIDQITINPNSFNGELINNLIALDKLIVYRLISKGINESDLDTIPSHVTDVNARNYDPSLPGTPEIYDIKIAEMSHIAASMEILGIESITELASIDTSYLTGLTSQDIEDLVQATVDPETDANTIIYYLISKTVDSTNTLFPDDDPNSYNPTYDYNYVMDNDGVRIRLTREAIASVLE